MIQRVVDRLHAAIRILEDQRRADPPDPYVLGLLEDAPMGQIETLQELLPEPEKAAT